MTPSTLPSDTKVKTKTKAKTVKTRILLLSDTHSSLPFPADHDVEGKVPFHHPLPSADVLIHTGDLTMTGSLSEHRAAVQLIRSIDAPLKIVIPGNHDLTLDRDYYAKYHDLHASFAKYSDEVLDGIQDMYCGSEARAAGIRYMVEGTASYKLDNGARLNVYASAWQPEFWNWAFGYARDVDRFNFTTHVIRTENAEESKSKSKSKPPPENPVPDFDDSENAVDVMLTHGPPMGILDQTMHNNSESVGCEHLRRAVQRCRPRLHCFGHIHEAWGACRKMWDVEDVDVDDEDDGGGGGGEGLSKGETIVDPGSYDSLVDRMGAYVDATDLEHGKETLFVNASIMNIRYRPLNAPWVVDLELPVADEDGDDVGDGQ